MSKTTANRIVIFVALAILAALIYMAMMPREAGMTVDSVSDAAVSVPQQVESLEQKVMESEPVQTLRETAEDTMNAVQDGVEAVEQKIDEATTIPDTPALAEEPQPAPPAMTPEAPQPPLPLESPSDAPATGTGPDDMTPAP